MENRAVPFRQLFLLLLQPFSFCLNVSVPLPGTIPTSTIPCMGTAIPLMTTAAACGHPHCLGSIMVGERHSLVSKNSLALFSLGVTGILLCLVLVGADCSPALSLPKLFSPIWRQLSHGHGCPSPLPTELSPSSVPDPHALCFLWTCAGPSRSPLLSHSACAPGVHLLLPHFPLSRNRPVCVPKPPETSPDQIFRRFFHLAPSFSMKSLSIPNSVFPKPQ